MWFMIGNLIIKGVVMGLSVLSLIKLFDLHNLFSYPFLLWAVENYTSIALISFIVILLLAGYGRFMRTFVNFIVSIPKRFAKK